MNNTGHARSSTLVRISPEPAAKVIEILRPGDPVEVRGEAGGMFEIVSMRLLPPIIGYVPKSSLVRRIPRVEVFSKIELNYGTLLADPAPADLPAVEFESWLQVKGEPAWLFGEGNAPFLVGDRMRREFQKYHAAWDEWFADVVKNNRIQTATLGEWYTVISGGMEVWSFRAERIFKEPTESSMALGWTSPSDILHWTGRVRYSEKEWKYKLWYEVELTKLDRTIKGWYKADLLEEFVIPEVYVEPNDRGGIAALFDMTKPKLRLPADPEIHEAILAKQNAHQYINVRSITGRNLIHHNLCGQFCIAALCGMDVVPILKQWYATSPRAKTILDGDRGSALYDLQQILTMLNVRSETFQPEPSVAPATPAYLQKMLNNGKKAIVGVGITSRGEVSYNGSIRHWLVVEEIVRMGNSGWLRVYNSFFNREEVYPYQRIFNTGIATGIGLWVDAPNYQS